ncbi:protein kinase [Mariniblastus sp.]|nr:protein kinase [Mariniblastus sp.]
MTQCPTTNQLKLLSGGQLNEQDSDILLLHLQACDDCQAEIGTLDRDDDTFIGDLKRLQNPDATASDLAMEPGYQEATAKALAAIGSLETREQTTELPKEFGDYKIVRPIGYGGMGSVYLGRHAKLDRQVAIKILAKHQRWNDVMHERFETEMRVVGKLNHPNIVVAYDARDVDDVAVLVTEFIDGLNVSELMRRKGRLEIDEACAIGAKICSALTYIGQKNLVHRDVKPSNIMVSTEGQVKLLDLGLTRLQSTDDQPADHTATGQAIGTPDYVSPEQIKDGRNVDYRADLYGLGCTMFKMLTGVAPFGSQKYASSYVKMDAHVSEIPPSVSSLRPEIPKRLNLLVQQLLEKSPAKRPQSAAEVEEILNTFGGEESLQPLVENAMKLSPNGAKLALQSNLQPLAGGETKPWLSRRFPAWALIALGLGGIAIGMLFGTKLTIKKPDGTVTTVEIPDGSTAQVDAEGDVTVQLAGNNGQKKMADKQDARKATPLTSGAGDPDLVALLNKDHERLQGVWRHYGRNDAFKKLTPSKASLFVGEHNASFRNTDEQLTMYDYKLQFDIRNGKRVFEMTSLDSNKKSHVPYRFMSGFLVLEDRSRVDPKKRFVEITRVVTPQTPGEAILLQANKTLQNSDGRIVLAIAKLKSGVLDKKSNMTIENLDIDPVQRMTQRDFASASVVTDEEGKPRLTFKISRDSVGRFSSITKKNVGQLLAIFFDGKLISAPRIMSPISSSGTVSGDFSKEELESIAAAINGYSNEIKSHIVASKRLLRLAKSLLSFEEANKYFPSSSNKTWDGKPCKPYSWRVAILPYIGQQALFDRYQFDEDWDSEENAKLLSEMPDLFRRGSKDFDSTTTGYLGIAYDRATFGDGDKKIENFTDGTSNTIAILQTDREVPWTKPEDLKMSDELIDELMQKNFPFSTIDGALHSIPKAKLNKQLLKNLIMMDDGNPVEIPGEARPSPGDSDIEPAPESP